MINPLALPKLDQKTAGYIRDAIKDIKEKPELSVDEAAILILEGYGFNHSWAEEIATFAINNDPIQEHKAIAYNIIQAVQKELDGWMDATEPYDPSMNGELIDGIRYKVEDVLHEYNKTIQPT